MSIASDADSRLGLDSPGGNALVARLGKWMEALPEVLSLKQAADALQCSTRTLRRRIAEGALRASQISDRGGWVVQRGDLLAFLDARATNPRRADPILPPRPGRLRRPSRHPVDGGRLVVTAQMGRPG